MCPEYSNNISQFFCWLLMNNSLIFQEEEEAGEVEYEDDVEPETSSTTETSKKFIKGGILRPFRSNDDLLATLKRRREQVATSK